MNRSLFLLALLIPATQAANLNVGSGQTFATIQAASDAANPGDTVYVYNGTYAGWRITGGAGHVSGTASAPITFLAQSPSVQITTPNSDGNGVTVNLVDYVVINGFTVAGMSNLGIDVVECQSCQILNNTVHDSYYSDILTGFCYQCLIQGNTAYNAGHTQHGIYVGNSARTLDAPVVRGNTSYGNAGAGIQFNGDCGTFDHLGQSDGMISAALVENNLLYNNSGSGISAINISDGVFRNNVMYGNLASANIKLADEGCNLGSNRNLIVNNTLVSATGLAGVRNVQGLGNTIFNNVIVTTGYKCVLDDTASNCSNGGEGNYYLAGLEKTPTQAATGIFVSYSGNNFALTSGSPAIAAGVASFNGWLAAPVDILGNVRPYGSGYDAGAYQYNSTAAGTDTQAPTTPGTPTASSLTPYQVTLTWTPSTDNVQVQWYYIYRGGLIIGLADSGQNAYTDTAISGGATYVYTVQAADAAFNVSAQSNGVSVSVPGIAGCINADASWRNRQMPTLTGSFTLETDVIPWVSTTNDGVVGFGPSVPTGYSNLGVIVQFGTSGNIQARNGSTYTADTVVPFAVGAAYHLRIPVNVTAHTYSVFVTPSGGPEISLASNYAFRSEQATAANLGYASAYDDQGSLSVCAIKINGTPLDSMTFLTIIPALGTPYVASVQIVPAISGGATQVSSANPAVTTVTASSYTLSNAVSGNQLLLFTSSSALVTVMVPPGLAVNDTFTLLQAGAGVLEIVPGAGVHVIQRRNSFRTAGIGSPLTLQGIGVQDSYVLWGDVQ